MIVSLVPEILRQFQKNSISHQVGCVFFKTSNWFGSPEKYKASPCFASELLLFNEFNASKFFLLFNFSILLVFSMLHSQTCGSSFVWLEKSGSMGEEIIPKFWDSGSRYEFILGSSPSSFFGGTGESPWKKTGINDMPRTRLFCLAHINQYSVNTSLEFKSVLN